MVIINWLYKYKPALYSLCEGWIFIVHVQVSYVLIQNLQMLMENKRWMQTD